jgi:hypothetical protein
MTDVDEPDWVQAVEQLLVTDRVATTTYGYDPFGTRVFQGTGTATTTYPNQYYSIVATTGLNAGSCTLTGGSNPLLSIRALGFAGLAQEVSLHLLENHDREMSYG